MKNFRDFFRGFVKGFKMPPDDLLADVNVVALAFIYVFGIGVPSLISRILGKRFLDIKAGKKAKSYWSDLNLGKKQKKDYFSQI